jgi:hypothetical protein
MKPVRCRLPTAILAVAPLLAFAADAPGKRLDLATPGTEQLGTGANDQVLALLRLADGGVLVGGYEGGQGGVEEGWPRGAAVGFVERRRASGELRWRREFDTPASDTVDALALAANGDIVVAGRTTGAFPGQTQRGQVDAYVAVLSADGELQDLLQAGDERPQHPVAVTTTRNGDLVLAGYDDIYIETNYVIDWHNGFLARFARGKDGALRQSWWLRSPIPANDFIHGVAAAKGSDDVFVAMQTATSASAGGGTFVRRVDRRGDVVWSHTVSQAWQDAVGGLATDAAGTIYVAGSTVTALGGPALGHSDGFVIALDPGSGQRRWVQRMQSPDPTWVTGLDVDGDGNVHLAGTAFLAEDVDVPRARSYALGQSWTAAGEPLLRWQTPVSAEPQWASTLRIAAGRSVHDLVVAGAVDGRFASEPAQGGYDRLMFAPYR